MKADVKNEQLDLSKEQKKQAINEIKAFFASEREEEIGDLAAEIILDFIAEKIGPYYYNKAISDVQKFMNEKIDDLYGFMIIK